MRKKSAFTPAPSATRISSHQYTTGASAAASTISGVHNRSWFPTTGVAVVRNNREKGITMKQRQQKQSIGIGVGWWSRWCFASKTPSSTTFCEGASPPNLPGPRSEALQEQQRQQQQQSPRPLSQQDPSVSCSTCRYTGTAVCVGLSLYFLRLATEDATTAVERWSRTAVMNQQPRQNKPFLYGGALVWAVAGIYRFSMDDD